ncbi:MAG: hypothetical protein U5Q03_18815 [Bacteroidota bacterium]|nr:hypothetical protein [Bacteroidota bacterium]
MKVKRFKRRTYSKGVFKEMLINRIAAFFTAAVVLIAGCSKFDPVTEIPAGDARTMGSLVVSDDFSWSMFQTLDVDVTSPQNEAIKPD